MSIGIDGANPWRATVERFDASPGRAYAATNGLSPWQALAAQASAGPEASALRSTGNLSVRPFAENLVAPSPWRATVVRAGTDPSVASLGAGQPQSAARPWQAIVTRAADADTATSAPAARADAPQSTDPAFDIERWRPKVEPTFSRPYGPERPPEHREPDDPDRVETSSKESANESTTLFASKDGLTFGDILDIINPFQHIPIISTIYRELTGDRISPGARVIGDGLLLGPIGAAFAVGNVFLAEVTGRDLGEHVVALLKESPADAPPTTVAAKSESTTRPVASVATDPMAGEKVLAELLPPGAMPVVGNQVDFASAALRPSAFSATPPVPPTPTTSSSAYAALLERARRNPEPTVAPRMPAAASVAPTADMKADSAATPDFAGRALPPDPMSQLAARRSPGQVAGNAAVGANQAAANGGWFGDVMLNALAKYEIQNRRNAVGQDNAPMLNVVN